MVLDMPTLLNQFPTSSLQGDGIGADVQQKVVIEAGAGIVPIGAIIPWLKSFTSVPTLITQNLDQLFLECDGSVISDPDSPLDGETLPDLNSTQRFLRGGSTSGTTGGADTHQHGLPTVVVTAGGGQTVTAAAQTDAGSTLPAHYEVVFLMRVK